MPPPIFWAVLLMLVGLALVITEIFVPSGGIIGFLALTSIVASIVLAFTDRGALIGLGFLLVASVAVPLALAAAFRFLPDTPVGRRLLPSIPTAADVTPDSDLRRLLRGLVGKVGKAKSKMLPSGAVEVEGHTIDAVSEGVAIDAGQRVRVVEVHGAMVVVRPVDQSEASQAAQRQAAEDDVLSQPIQSLGLDPMEDPLA